MSSGRPKEPKLVALNVYYQLGYPIAIEVDVGERTHQTQRGIPEGAAFVLLADSMHPNVSRNPKIADADIIWPRGGWTQRDR
jgi:hypothetical protein